MPTLSSALKTKRVVLGREGEEDVWVEIKSEILARDLYTDGSAKVKEALDFLVSILVDWNFTLENGEKAPITKETIMLLPIRYLTELHRHIEPLLNVGQIDPAKKKI